MIRGLTLLVFLATCLGGVFGLACHACIRDPQNLDAIARVLELVSGIFLRAIRMLIAPLVLCTLIAGIGKMGDSGAIGRVAVLTLSWFAMGSVVSMLTALALVELIAPGAGLHLTPGAGAVAIKAAPPSMADFVTNLVPTSLFDAMSHNEVLQIVIFAVVAGLAVVRLKDAGKSLIDLADAVTQLMLRMAGYVMAMAPLAVFAAVAAALVREGGGIVLRYASYLGGFYVTLAFLWAGLMVAGAAVLGWRRQRQLMKEIRQPALIALTTTSSEAAYPVLLEKLEGFGVPDRIAGFVLPLGYSFNLIGSMCYCVFAFLFVAQAYDISMPAGKIVQLLLLVFVTSKGIANVPRASLLVVVTLLPFFRIPESAALLILAVDHFLDMGRTCTNTVAISIAAVSVAKWEEWMKPAGG